MPKLKPRRTRTTEPPLRIHTILVWADAHKDRTGEWPKRTAGPIPESPGRSWENVDAALRSGYHGLPGGSSLARLLETHRGVRNIQNLPRLTIKQVVTWADRHYARTGCWPTENSGAISGAKGETWANVTAALQQGLRGFRGGSSLAQVLEKHRGKRNRAHLSRLTYKQIVEWADDHRKRTGKWPTHLSGGVLIAPGESWGSVNAALRDGGRGLNGGYSLAGLLTERRGYLHANNKPRLTIKQILKWADEHHRRTGRWPGQKSGEIQRNGGETWSRVAGALLRSQRGLRRGTSLANLLEQRRGRRNLGNLKPLTIGSILSWMDFHHNETGEWPKPRSGRVLGAPEETWAGIQHALREGRRGLSCGWSLARVLEKYRGVRNWNYPPRLTVGRILMWARAHRRRTGERPKRDSGEIPEAPGETWRKVSDVLRAGRRGLPGGFSLNRLLAENHAA